MQTFREAAQAFREGLLQFIGARIGEEKLGRLVLQEFLMRLQVRGRFLPVSENLSAWLYRLLRNTILDYCKLHGIACQAPLPEEGLLPKAPDGIEALQEVHLEFRQTLQALLRQGLLENAEAEALQLIEWKSLSEKEAEGRLQISSSDLQRDLLGARQKLLQSLLAVTELEWQEHELYAIEYESFGPDFYC